MKVVYLGLFAIYAFGSLFTPSNACVYNDRISVPQNDLKCRGINGQCISTSSTCNGKFVAYHCPGRDVCCVNIQASECDRHLIASEGNMYLDGYIPTSGSGVTIASGVDIGQRLPREYNGLDRDIFQKLEPYMATAPGKPKNKAEVCRDSKINKNRLTLSVSEASRLDQFFKEIASNKNSEYTKKLNKGKCVVQSLNHYCGDLLVRRKENKCNFSGCDSFIRNALIGKTATDSTFESALIAHRNCIKTKGSTYSHVAERFRKEICYINSSHSFC
uniref:Pesticin C-terminal domain-containing protein n=1 Tax=Lepeophtheirus salmonis TaxID=72036 RepID=A0A0K2TL62_LEPSM